MRTHHSDVIFTVALGDITRNGSGDSFCMLEAHRLGLRTLIARQVIGSGKNGLQPATSGRSVRSVSAIVSRCESGGFVDILRCSEDLVAKTLERPPVRAGEIPRDRVVISVRG